MGMGFAPTWLRQVSTPASQNHFNHCLGTVVVSRRRRRQGLKPKPVVKLTVANC